MRVATPDGLRQTQMIAGQSAQAGGAGEVQLAVRLAPGAKALRADRSRSVRASRSSPTPARPRSPTGSGTGAAADRGDRLPFRRRRANCATSRPGPRRHGAHSRVSGWHQAMLRREARASGSPLDDGSRRRQQGDDAPAAAWRGTTMQVGRPAGDASQPEADRLGALDAQRQPATRAAPRRVRRRRSGAPSSSGSPPACSTRSRRTHPAPSSAGASR